MRSYTVNSFGEELEPVDAAAPEPTGTQVVIEMQRCGVCHSDLHIQDGYFEIAGGKRMEMSQRGVTPPIVMGHEVLGKLVAKGPEAPIDDDRIGRAFLVYPWIGCGKCAVCQRGDENICPNPASIGVLRPGGYSEQCVVPHPRYLVDTEGVDPALAATYACSGLTAYSALNKVGSDRKADLLLIVGLGGVGQNGLMIAKAMGFERIAVADIDPDKRETALKNGATIAVDPKAEQAPAELQKAGGVVAAVDFVGASMTAQFITGVLVRGGTYVLVGLFGGELTLSLPIVVQRAMSILGSYTGNLRELNELIDLARSGKIEPIPIETVPFDTVNDALNRLRKGKVTGRLVLER